MALNLLAPGLGLLRAGRARLALLLLALPVVATLGSAALFAVAPLATFRWTVLYVAVLGTIVLATVIAAMRLTWRHSALRPAVRPWWSRWYSLLSATVIAVVAGNVAAAACHRSYKPFYIPAESMAPTLALHEKIIADMRFRGPARIGDLVLIDTPTGTYIKRIAALAGNRIAMRNAVPILNGRPAVQTGVGPAMFRTSTGPEPANLLVERFPGDERTHRILDLGPSPIDDMGERIVPVGHVFVLGDNRDRSADSRVPRSQYGVEMVDLNAIVGRPLFIHWSQDRSRIGTLVMH
jgi:signal peptidase I